MYLQAYLQETMINNDEYTSSRVLGHSLSGQSGRSTDGQLDSFAVEMETCDDQLSVKNDRLRVLENTVMTNASLQVSSGKTWMTKSSLQVSSEKPDDCFVSLREFKKTL